MFSWVYHLAIAAVLPVRVKSAVFVTHQEIGVPEDECTRHEAYEENFGGRAHQLAIQLKQQFHERPILIRSIYFEAFDHKPTRYRSPDISGNLMTYLSFDRP